MTTAGQAPRVAEASKPSRAARFVAVASRDGDRTRQFAAVARSGHPVLERHRQDTRINEKCRIYGVLDDRFQRVPADQHPVNIGGHNTLNRWPANSSWDFVAVGRGHDQEFWSRFLQALYAVDPGMAGLSRLACHRPARTPKSSGATAADTQL